MCKSVRSRDVALIPTTVRLEQGLIDDADHEAALRGVDSRSDFIRQALVYYLAALDTQRREREGRPLEPPESP